ncbi:MAG: riboflavin synthase [bacterium]
MFTGIIEEIGTISNFKRDSNVARLAVKAEIVIADMKIGDSLAVNGVCLTVESFDNHIVNLTMMPETLKTTTVGSLLSGNRVNLERAMQLNGRLGGHIVSGHVDGIGKLIRIGGNGEERILYFSMPSDLSKYIAHKGSITVSGVSLTVIESKEDSFSVSLVRHTLAATILNDLKIGDAVNIEIDVIARYIEKLLNKTESGGLTEAKLRELGY